MKKQKFRLKAYDVDVLQWMDNLDDILELCHPIGTCSELEQPFLAGQLFIELEGVNNLIAQPTDWIIRGPGLKLTICKDEVFESVYEKA